MDRSSYWQPTAATTLPHPQCYPEIARLPCNVFHLPSGNAWRARRRMARDPHHNKLRTQSSGTHFRVPVMWGTITVLLAVGGIIGGEHWMR